MPAKELSISELRRVNLTEPGKGAWRVLYEPIKRRYRIRHSRTGSSCVVYYGTRTERTMEAAEVHAVAIAATLNALKAKRC
jgi:hypothetical protein